MSKLRELTRTWLRWAAEMEDRHGQPVAAGLAADMGFIEQERVMKTKELPCSHCGQNLLLGADTTSILDALKERAERVLEGEEWDLAEYILHKYEEVYSEPVH